MSAETVWKKYLLLEKVKNFFFRFSVDCFMARFSILPVMYPEEHFKEFFWNFLSFKFGLWAKKIRTLEYKALPLLSKQHLICREDQLWKSHFFRNFVVPFSSDFGRNCSGILQKIRGRVVKTVFHLSAGSF